LTLVNHFHIYFDNYMGLVLTVVKIYFIMQGNTIPRISIWVKD